LIGRALEALVRFKNNLIQVDQDVPVTGVEIIGGEDEDYEDDGEPLTWAEQKNVRVELRRFLTWHALRMKVPSAWENPQ